MSEEAIHVTDEATQDFLNLEGQAQRLVASLSRLDEGSKRYAAAAGSLEKAADATGELTEAVRSIGVAASEAIDVVASTGGPEIMGRISGLESSIEAMLSGRISELEASVETMIRRLNLVYYVTLAAAAIAAITLVAVLILK